MRKAVLFLGVIGVFAIWVLLRAAGVERRAEAEFPPEGRIVSVDGGDVHAVVMGEGPDVVLIHGTGGNTRDMTLSLAPKLAERYRVFVMDRPGLGYTPSIGRGGDSIIDQARHLQKAAVALGANDPIVMGHSYGGAVALAWAVDMPHTLSALALVSSPSHPWDTPLDPLYQITSHPVAGPLVIPLLTAFVPGDYVARTIEGIFAPQSAPAGYADAVAAQLSLRRASLRATGQQRANLLGEIQELAARYGEITAPTEILHGAADDTVSPKIHAEAMAKDIPGARYVALEGVGHMPHHVAQDAVIALIDRAAGRVGLR